ASSRMLRSRNSTWVTSPCCEIRKRDSWPAIAFSPRLCGPCQAVARGVDYRALARSAPVRDRGDGAKTVRVGCSASEQNESRRAPRGARRMKSGAENRVGRRVSGVGDGLVDTQLIEQAREVSLFLFVLDQDLRAEQD